MKLLEEYEGKRRRVYLDSANLETIGIGHLLTKDERSSGKLYIKGRAVKYGNGGLNDEEIYGLLAQDLEPVEAVVEQNVKVPLTQPQFDALVIFAFNVGNGAFRSSTLLRCLNRSEYEEVPIQMRRWNRAGGKVLQGLINRREKEIKMWQT